MGQSSKRYPTVNLCKPIFSLSIKFKMQRKIIALLALCLVFVECKPRPEDRPNSGGWNSGSNNNRPDSNTGGNWNNGGDGWNSGSNNGRPDSNNGGNWNNGGGDGWNSGSNNGRPDSNTGGNWNNGGNNGWNSGNNNNNRPDSNGHWDHGNDGYHPGGRSSEPAPEEGEADV